MAIPSNVLGPLAVVLAIGVIALVRRCPGYHSTTGHTQNDFYCNQAFKIATGFLNRARS
jgi:hypothetical protein